MQRRNIDKLSASEQNRTEDEERFVALPAFAEVSKGIALHY